MKRNTNIIASLLLASMSSVALAAPQTGPVAVSGCIDFSGYGADGARVWLENKPAGFTPANAGTVLGKYIYADPAGCFELSDPGINQKSVPTYSTLKADWKLELFNGVIKCQFTGTSPVVFPSQMVPGQTINLPDEDISVILTGCTT